MMRDEVTVQDAIVAVAVMECSMQVSETCPPMGVALIQTVWLVHRVQHCWAVLMHYTHRSLQTLMKSMPLKVE